MPWVGMWRRTQGCDDSCFGIHHFLRRSYSDLLGLSLADGANGKHFTSPGPGRLEKRALGCSRSLVTETHRHSFIHSFIHTCMHP